MSSVSAPGAPRPQRPLRASARTIPGPRTGFFVLFLAVTLTGGYLSAQSPASGGMMAAATTRPASSPGVADGEPSEVQLLVGRSQIVNSTTPITRVSLTSPDIADALVTGSHQVLIHGKAPGTISMFLWDRGGAIRRYEVVVQRDLSQLRHHLQQLFPGENITVHGNGKDVVVSGVVSSKYVIDKAAEVAAGYVAKKDDVVNLLRQQEGIASNQVLLRVRFAEVSRSALQELGSSFVANGYKSEWFGRTTTQQFAAPEWDEEGRLVFSDFLNLFVYNSQEGLGALVRALQNRGVFQSLAEPNLVATNGKEASFLAGGEFPYPVVQAGAMGNAITIMFKEFGIRLNFTPTVLGNDLINLKVRPEVSALDFSNAVTLEGFRIPALTTRRTETEVELRDGQTFAVAGLMNNTATSSMSKIPGIGDIPILGLLFRSRAYQKQQTELVVMITPQILRRGAPGAAPALPNLVEPYLGRPSRQIPPPPPGMIGGQPPPPARDDAAQQTQPPTPGSQPQAPATATAPAVGPTAPAAAPSGAAVAPAPTKEQREAAMRAHKAFEQQQEADARRRAEEQKRLAEARRQQERLAAEQAKRDTEAARKAAEQAKKQAEEDKKRGQALAAAEAKLKAAQAAYQAELDKTKKPSSQEKR